MSQQTEDSTETPVNTTRRKLLMASGALATTGLAGCESSDEQGADDLEGTTTASGSTDTTTGTDESKGRLVVDELATAADTLPEQMNFNPFEAGSGRFYPHFFETQIEPVFGLADTTFAVNMLEDYSIEGGGTSPPTLIRKFPEGDWKWWNGMEVTAEDAYVQEKINWLATTPEDRMTKAPEVVDKYTLKIEYTELRNVKDVRDTHMVGGAGQVPVRRDSQWADHLEAMEDATTFSEIEEIAGQFGEVNVRIDEFVEKGLGHGPYKITDWSEVEITAELFDEHPRADDIDIPKLRFPVAAGDGGSSSTAFRQLVVNDILDYRTGILPPELEGAKPDTIEHIDQWLEVNGMGLHLNWQNKHLARAGVRRALLTAINLPNIILNGFPENVPVRLQTGMSKPLNAAYLGSDFVKDLYQYPIEDDQEQAAKFMQHEGYSLEGSQWVDADGDPVEITIDSPTWGAFVLGSQTMKGQLEDFGFNVDLVTNGYNGWTTRLGNGNFDLSWWWQAGNINEPYAYGTFRSWNPYWAGWVDADEDERTLENKPINPTIPAIDDVVSSIEDGLDTSSASGETVNLINYWNEHYPRATSEEDLRDLARVYARWWNFSLPDIRILTEQKGIWGDVQDFNWPEAGSEKTRSGTFPATTAVKRGWVNGKYE